MKPGPFLDNRGAVIEMGQRVAYNLSGQVALGQVRSVGVSHRYSRVGPLIKVELLHDAAGQHAGHISKVTNEKNLLVLRPHDADSR